ncbi:MAG: leucine/isoleucine/valine transporter permease subunit [Firmicutes bacterium ADurb.Bin467]|nr:MAG: leucine/isoleucine/valine transporter permease subunit [Firmicutes bacterium ADurb.Bin467]
MKKSATVKSILQIALVALLLAFPLVGFRPYIYRVGVLCLIYAILAASLNLLSGVAGQISLGHIAYYAVGAYASALLALNYGVPHWLLMIASFAAAAVTGLLIGLPSLRLSGGYLAITTLGFAEIIRLVMINWYGLTNGPLGLLNIPRPVYFGYVVKENRDYFYLALAVLLITVAVLRNLINSRFGRNLKALRDDEISAGFAGVAGSLYAHYFIFLEPGTFESGESTVILSMVVLGGMGSMWGAIAAAAILTFLPEALRVFSDYRMFAYGVLLVFMMLSKTVNWAGLRRRIFPKPREGGRSGGGSFA